MNKSDFCLRVVFLLLLIVMLAVAGFAQNESYKREVYGNIGYGMLGDDEGSHGRDLMFGGGFGYRLSRRWGLAIEASRNGNHRETAEFVMDGYAALVGGALQYHLLAERKTQPYLRFGLSYARYDGRFIPNPSTPPSGFSVQPGSGKSGAQNFIGPDFGIGAKIFVTKSVSIRPEFRVAPLRGLGGYEPFRHVLEPPLFASWFSVGIGYHW
ncbi:MAG: porin family protein [Acidobacteria bacterium]|nr:porin family protein [Acidobacteriota bacterium]